jgi:ABC-type enterochelin transport system permease subunit
LNFWEFLLVMMITLPIMVMWLGCVIDIIGRPDISGFAKAAWMLFVIFLPLIGAVVYAVTRPKTIVTPSVSGLDSVYIHGRDPAEQAAMERAKWGSQI